VNRILLCGGIAAAVAVAACADVGTGPEVPAAIELPPFAFPTVVVGDTLRDSLGAVAPIKAIVRNSAGGIIADARPSYLYADYTRDSAFRVDTITGIVVARAKVIAGRLAARIGSSLQVLRTLSSTVRPDTAVSGSAPSALIVSLLPDTGRTRAEGNTTGGVSVQLRNLQETTPVGVDGWLVSFRLVKPTNPTNDTTKGVFLVDEQLRASMLDTTSSEGTASRRVRVRPASFPVPQGSARVTDTVIVEATARYRGRLVRGAPVRVFVQVVRPASQ
jgi:hypothetical protein